MNYEITDLHRILKIKFKNVIPNYNSVYARVYINDTPHRQYIVPVLEDNQVVYKIRTSSYSLGDIITKIELYTDRATKLWETTEGIVWLINGAEIATTHTDNYSYRFGEEGEYDVQAVYVGNDSIAMATTDKVHFEVKQPQVSNEDASSSNDGNYSIAFVNKNLSTLNYCGNEKIEFILTKGGVPVVGRTVERVSPTGGIGSQDTKAGGIVVMQNTNWSAGKHKIGAYYYDENRKIICSTYKNVTVKKGTPTWRDNSKSKGDFVKGSKYKANLEFNKTALSDVKVTLFVNNKATTLKTSKGGAVYYKFPSKGTYTLKLVYKGNNNYNKAELTQTITVKE